MANRPGGSALTAPIRPVSARTYMRNDEAPAASPMPLQSFKSYKNDLFGDEEGDVLAGETIPAARPIEVTAPRPTTPSGRVQQQIALNQQKRLARLQGGMATQPNMGRAASLSSRPTTPGSFTASEAASSPMKSPGMQPSKANSSALTELVPFNTTQTMRPASTQVLQLSAASSTAEQSLLAHGLASVYDPSAQEEATPASKGPDARLALQATPSEALDTRAFLMMPGGTGSAVQCSIHRDKSSKMYPKYQLVLESGQRFLMSARKRKKSKTHNYILSFDQHDTSRQSPNFAGKMRANFLGTGFLIYDKGLKPSKAEGADVRCELAGVKYEYNVLGTRGPRKMTALIPGTDAKGQAYVFRPEADNDSILDRHRQQEGLDQMTVMSNKSPRWNEQLGAYCLNFNGRVTQASVKNFQLVSESDPEYIILQFGKVGKDRFTMDYRHPMNAFQAFGICLSSFDNKLGSLVHLQQSFDAKASTLC